MTTAASAVRRMAERELGLTAAGGLGLAVAAVCAAAVAIDSPTVAPEGKLLDAAVFAFGVGVYTLTMALLLPLAGLTAAARRRWRCAFYPFAVYGVLLEAVQSFRGLDPRFSEVGDTVDSVTGVVFGLTALVATVLAVVLALRFARRDVLADRPVLRLGIRYGMASVLLSFAVGVAMSALSGREVDGEGDLLLSHGLAVHGIQSLPIVGILLQRTGAAPTSHARRWAHLAGVGWLAAGIAALAQALAGRPPWNDPLLTAAIVLGLATRAVAAVVAAARQWSARQSSTVTVGSEATEPSIAGVRQQVSGPAPVGRER